jgi:hypothetical protein
VTCQLIDRLRRFKSPHAIPALIEFLQDDGLGLPALKAQKALKELTGYDFPTDVFASRAAWKKVQRIDDAKRRMAELAKMLPYEAEPFAGELVTEGKSSFLVLTNHSTKPVTILREPSDISCTAPGASLGNGGKPPEHRSDFVVIQPGATFRIKVRSAYGQYPRLERMTASFLRNGNEFGVNAWIGVVELKFEKKQ